MGILKDTYIRAGEATSPLDSAIKSPVATQALGLPSVMGGGFANTPIA